MPNFGVLALGTQAMIRFTTVALWARYAAQSRSFQLLERCVADIDSMWALAPTIARLKERGIAQCDDSVTA